MRHILSFCCFFDVLKFGNQNPDKLGVGLFNVLPKGKDFRSQFSGTRDGVVDVGSNFFI